MSGHSKWNNIKNRKGAQDEKKGKIFSQLSRQIREAAKQGNSGDPKVNASLRLVLDKARAANMPKEKVQRAIDVALGNGEASNVKEVIYEGFAPGGIGMMIVAFTDNANRTASDVRNILSKAGGSLGGPGSVKYMFERAEDGSFAATMKLDVAEDQLDNILELIETLEENDDVEEVFIATDLPDSGEEQ
jgi:YebC/PmpR family DNA-binding regulatory protein